MATAADFQPLTGTRIRVGPAELVLQSVEPHGPDAFTLILSGPSSPVLPEGCYETDAGGHAIRALYVIPIHTRGTDRQDYQVVFN